MASPQSSLEEIEEWLNYFKSEEVSLPPDETNLRPKYILLCRRLAFTRRTLHILKILQNDLPGSFSHLRQDIQNIRDGSASVSVSLPSMLRSLLQELHKLNGMLSLKSSAFSDAYPHHGLATLKPTFDIESDPFAEVYKAQDPYLETCASADFLRLFEDLDLAGKYFLMCFSVFPPDTVVDKRALAYWCVGMGVLLPSECQLERLVDVILEDLVVKGFVVAEKRNFKLVGFKLCPLVRCFAVKMAERFDFYAFNDGGVPSFHSGEPSKVFLSREGTTSSLAELSETTSDERLHKVECILNVNEPYPDFDLLHFTKMKNLSVLCLGRSSAGQHIELESLDFLRGLKVVKNLTILSLRGISQVFRLPDALWEHSHLRVLDLNSCHNLEELPEEIRLLKNLTHLDISKCYLLDRMPKGLASLRQLRLLKGFLVVADEASCAFASLAGLNYLHKLSLYVHKIDFPEDHEQRAFHELPLLRDFTIQWGGRAVKWEHSKVDKPNTVLEEVIVDGYGGSTSRITLPTIREIRSGDKAEDVTASPEILEGGQDVTTEVPGDVQVAPEDRNTDKSMPQIKRVLTRFTSFVTKKDPASEITKQNAMLGAVEKLVLQCYPREEMPSWLVPSTVPQLKQLHIKGGKLRRIGDAWIDGTSKLEMLRLNYLKEFEMDVEGLQRYFPMLNRFAKVECPKLSGFPADDCNMRFPPPSPRPRQGL